MPGDERQRGRAAASRKGAVSRKKMLAARRAALTDPAAPPVDIGPITHQRGDFTPREILDRIRSAASRDGP